MTEVEISGRKVTVERFTLAKATRVMTLLQKLQQEVPEVSKSWAEFNRDYAENYPTRLSRIQAIAQFGLDIPDDEWERADQTFPVPGKPNSYEVFFHMAPLVYERAEELTLRLLGLIAMPNETVKGYVKDGDIWERVDQFVDDVIIDAPLDEIMELVVTAAEVIDRQVLAKARTLGERAGNVARLLGIKTMERSETSTTSSEEPVRPSTVSVSSSPGTSDGTPTESSDSPGTPSTLSRTSSPASVTSS
jgi:hypothetical protein